MEHYLDTVKSFVDRLRATNSRLEKEAILREYSDEIKIPGTLNLLLHYVYDYDKQYYVTSANVLKLSNLHTTSMTYMSVWQLLNDLSNKVIVGHAAISAINSFLAQSREEHRQLILDILDKDLKCGLTETTINKIIPGIIKTYDVCLANKYDKNKHTIDGSWVIERKMDGVRCQIIYKNAEDIRCYSRQGKEFTTLTNIVEQLRGKLPNNTVLDGEICVVDPSGIEDFQGIMKEIKRKDHTIKNPRMVCFDMLTLNEFESKQSTTNYVDRLENLISWKLNHKDVTTITPIDYSIYSEKTFDQLKKKASDSSWEGLMLRKNTTYEGKRTDNLLKVKSFKDAEYTVIDIEEGDAQELVDGVMTKIKCVGSLVILHKGNRVGVGTGLTLEQRKLWYSDPKSIIGSVVSIKYFEETQNKDGSYSLRFPVLLAVYGKERDI